MTVTGKGKTLQRLWLLSLFALITCTELPLATAPPMISVRTATAQQPGETYRAPVRRVRIDSVASGKVYYTVLESELTPNTVGRKYSASIGTWLHNWVLEATAPPPPPANVSPTASFTSACTDLVCTFTSTSADSDGSIAAQLWNFGDGTGATTTTVQHTYSAAGSYGVALTVTDDDGAAASTSKTVTVTAPSTPPPPLPPPSAPSQCSDASWSRTLVDSRGDDKYFGHSQTAPGPWTFGGLWNDTPTDGSRPGVWVVNDAAAPHGKAFQKNMPIGTPSGWSGLATIKWTFHGGNVAELCQRVVMATNPGWQPHAAIDKLWYWGDGAGIATFYVGAKPNRYLRLHIQMTSSQSPGSAVAIYDAPQDARFQFADGVYHTIEVHTIAQSAPGVADGAIYVWFDGVLVPEWIRVPGGPVAPLTNMQFHNANATAAQTKWAGGQFFLYYGGSGTTKQQNDWVRVGELVIRAK